MPIYITLFEQTVTALQTGSSISPELLTPEHIVYLPLTHSTLTDGQFGTQLRVLDLNRRWGRVRAPRIYCSLILSLFLLFRRLRYN